MTIYITGDLHGNSANVRERIAQIDFPKEEDVIIVCGDAGLEYGAQIQGSAKKEMKKFPGTWLILRGNHDTRYWRDHTEEVVGDNGVIEVIPQKRWSLDNRFDLLTLVQDKYPNIHYIQDNGGMYNIEGSNFFCIPGAYSVDKFYRLANHLSYEYEEQLSYKEFSKLYEVAVAHKDEIDYVIAHTFPQRLEYKLRYLFLDCIDQKQVNKNSEEWLNTFMDTLGEGKRFKKFFGGHYHDDKNLESKYIMLYNTVVKLEDE